MNNLVTQTLKIMSMGMGTVFFVLLLFYAIVRLLVKIFPYREDVVESNGSTDR